MSYHLTTPQRTTASLDAQTPRTYSGTTRARTNNTSLAAKSSGLRCAGGSGIAGDMKTSIPILCVFVSAAVVVSVVVAPPASAEERARWRLQSSTGMAPAERGAPRGAEGGWSEERADLVSGRGVREPIEIKHLGAGRRGAETSAAVVRATPKLRCSRTASRPLLFKRTAEDPEGDSEPARVWMIEAHARYVTLPDFFIDDLFQDHTSMHSVAAGASAVWRFPGAGEWWFSVDYLRLGYAAGNWREASLPPASSSHLEWDLGFLSVAAGYNWRFALVERRLFAVVGLGAAFGGFIGDVYATDVVPTCQEPVAACPHWRRKTRRALELPTRVLALPIVNLGLGVRLVDALWLRVEAGLFGIPYAGLSLAYGGL